MNMKEHILAALREQFNRWEELLASDEQIADLYTLSDWTTKDVMTHLWAWQQISVARLEAATLNRKPEFPKWVTESGKDWEENADQTNAWVYKNYHEQPWSKIHQNWKEGFLRLLELGDKIPEADLLNGDKYPWLEGYSLAFILVASYDHHQEHYDKLVAWLKEHGKMKIGE